MSSILPETGVVYGVVVDVNFIETATRDIHFFSIISMYMVCRVLFIYVK